MIDYHLLAKKVFSTAAAREKGYVEFYLQNPGRFNSEKESLMFILAAITSKKIVGSDTIVQQHRANFSKIVPNDSVDSGASNVSGQYRGKTTSQTIAWHFFHKSTVTLAGILEIINLIQAEKNYPEFKGTWFGPDPHKGYNPMACMLHSSTVLDKIREAGGVRALAESLLLKYSREGFAMCLPRTSDIDLTTPLFLETKLDFLLNILEGDLEQSESDDAKIRLIVKFIKDCLRLHPFDDGNHRVFAKDILNFFLVRENIGFCPLPSRGVFMGNGLAESVQEVNANIFKFRGHEVSPEDFVHNFLNELRQLTPRLLEERPVKKRLRPVITPTDKSIESSSDQTDKGLGGGYGDLTRQQHRPGFLSSPRRRRPNPREYEPLVNSQEEGCECCGCPCPPCRIL